MRKNVLVSNFNFIMVSLGLSLFYCWMINRSFLSRKINLELFREVNASIFGYSSLQSYFLIYLPLFFLVLNFFISGERDYRTVRLKCRGMIAVNRIKVLGKTIGIMILPHFLVQVLCNLIIFGKTEFICTRYFQAELLQIISVVMTYFILGLCFEDMMLYLRREVSLCIVIIGSLLYYFVNRIFLNYILLRELCIRDLILGGNNYSHEFFIGLIMNITVLLALTKLMFMGLKEADVYEK